MANSMRQLDVDSIISLSTWYDSLEKRKNVSFLRGSSGKPYVHFLAAEAEYGTFYSMPMLAEMLR